MRQRDLLRVIGGNLRAERARRHLTQESLAELAGVGVAQLARMERGEVDAGVSKYIDIAWALGLDPSELFHGLEGSPAAR